MESLHEYPPRRNSFRRSLSSESGLSPEFLEQLEAKRRALDDSIHRFIASKEREYQAYEKELRHQAKRTDGVLKTDKANEAPSAVETLLRSSTSKKLHDSTSEVDFGLCNGATETGKEDFPGVFTPEYLSALEHHELERTASAPSAGAADTRVNLAVLRTNSDSAAQISRPTRLPLSQRTSSSGSSVDAKLISALKSSSEVSRSGKRVSLAVGDAIVKPSDSVPVALKVNSTSSHSRSRTPAPQSLLDASQATSVLEDGSATSRVSAAVRTLQEQGSASAALRDIEQTPLPSQQEDVGDMFDLEEEEINATYDRLPDSSPEDYFDNDGGNPPSDTERNLDSDMGEPPPDDIVRSEPLIFAEGAAATKQPASPGFRRPSAAIDPVYMGKDYKTTEENTEESSFYGSSYSRTSKGSFTSSSLGESFMARNAEKLMSERTQPQQTRQSTHVMSVR